MPQCKLTHPYSPNLNTLICILEKGHGGLHLTYSFLGERYEWGNSSYEDRRVFFEAGNLRVEILEILEYSQDYAWLALVKFPYGCQLVSVDSIRIL